MIDLKGLSTDQLLDLLNQAMLGYQHHDQARITFAKDLMLEAHKDLKPRPDGPRVNHILRVTLKTIEFGAAHANTVIKALLHDTVEEVAEKLAYKYFAKFFRLSPAKLPGKETFQFFALEYIDEMLGKEPAAGVGKLTIPRHWDLAVRHTLYIEHVSELLDTPNHPEEAKVKLADFSENGLNLQVIADAKFRKNMCQRYLPLYDKYIDAILAGRITLTPEHHNEMLAKLRASKQYAQHQLEMPA